AMTDKVNELIEKYNEVCEANEALRNELVSVKAQNEAKSNQIMRLEEELKSRNIESEDIYKKIEAVLGR
ncbi:ABC transporter, partial [Campylobacter jejuni CVM 41905]